MTRIAACLFGLLLAVSVAAQPATLTGMLTGADGGSPAAAHVHAIPAGAYAPVASTAAGEDGRFTLAVEPGVYTVRFTGASHRALDVPFGLESGETEIDAHLAAVPVFASPDEVRVQVYGGRSRRLDPQADGTFAATVPAEADTVAYQIVRAFKHGRPANGTAWDRLVWDGEGGYFAVLDAPGDSVRVTFDPRLMPRSDRLPEVNFAEPQSRASRVTAVLTELDNRSERVYQTRRRVLAATQDRTAEARADALAEAMAPFDLPAEDDRLAAAVASEADDAVRQALLLNYLSVETEPKTKDPALALRSLAEIGPASGLWALHPALVQRALDIAMPADSVAAAQAAQRLVDAHPNAAVRAYVLLDRLDAVDRAGDVAASQELFLQLQSDAYVETDPGLIAAALFEHYDTRGGIHVGADAPDFSVQTLGGAEVSRESLLGIVYLLDFWAIWCAPCIREMPTLHAAYDRFHEQGFEILSVSFDDAAEEVQAFRAERFPMPWLNAHVGSDFGTDIARAFEVGSLPRPLLIGADGRIVARDNALRGADLERTLEAILGGG